MSRINICNQFVGGGGRVPPLPSSCSYGGGGSAHSQKQKTHVPYEILCLKGTVSQDFQLLFFAQKTVRGPHVNRQRYCRFYCLIAVLAKAESSVPESAKQIQYTYNMILYTCDKYCMHTMQFTLHLLLNSHIVAFCGQRVGAKIRYKPEHCLEER